MAEEFEHAGVPYSVQFAYDMDAWCMELSEANAVTRLPGPAFLVAVVPDEDMAPEPTIHVGSTGERDIPYEVMRWFMAKVAEQVEQRGAGLIETGRHGT
ncbi:hypothetical protein AB0873_20605 [Micromonospora sp. NPDC047707]|uniref:hypothetical protein n=1 Tax=Micromonospora sp. NPDC047707 TaxID=3154498 RepID=UPI0034559E56